MTIQMKRIKLKIISATCVLLSSFAWSQGSLGRVTAVNPERGLIEIDGAVYSITQEALKAGDSPGKTTRSFREGHIVRYSAKEQRLEAITLIDNLKVIPQ